MARFVKGGHLQPGSSQMPPFVRRGEELPAHQAPHFGSKDSNVDGNALAMAAKSDKPARPKVASANPAKARAAIHIKKSKRGTFTAAARRAGKSVQEEASSVLSNPNASPAMKKKANFARNAAKWNH